jgi:hypothetical protein
MDKIDWRYLSLNPNAISLLERNIDKIDWHFMSRYGDLNLMVLLNNHIDKINWNGLSANKNAKSILEKNINKINWLNLIGNRGTIDLLIQNIEIVIKTPSYLRYLNNVIYEQMWNENIIYLVIYLVDNDLLHYFIHFDNYFYTNKLYWKSLFTKYYEGKLNLIEKLETNCITLSKKVIQDYHEFKKIYFKNENNININVLFRYEDIFIVIDYPKIMNKTNIFKEQLIMKSCHPYIVNKSLLKYNYLDC